MRKQAVAFAVAAAGLAGCGITPGPEYRNDRDLPIPPGQGMFGDATTFQIRWRSGAKPEGTADAEHGEFMKWRESAGSRERSEFEDWRAWQEWKKKNPK